ncbi:MAG TPA: EAL domain-containing protein [Micropepsaceae bacterium]|nr:EAL domain-containing protein [Micropepsaceae bacterium]
MTPPKRGSVLFWVGALAMMAIIAGGAGFVDVVKRAGSKVDQQDLMTEASVAATAFELETDALRKIEYARDNTSSPSLAAVRETLKHSRGHIAQAQFVYLMGLRDQTAYFIGAAEEPTSPDPFVHRPFSASEPLLESPYVDRWGTWVSGLAPMIGHANGEVIAVPGIDGPASWEQQIGRYGLIAGAIASLFAIICGVALLAQAQSQRRIAALNVQLKAEVDKLEKSNRIVENSSTVLFRMNVGPSWPLSYVSHNIDRYGYSVAALLESPAGWLDHFCLSDPPNIRENLEDLRSGKADTIRGVQRFKKGDDSWAWVANSMSAVHDETGRLVAVEGIMSDVTQVKNAEERIAHLAVHDTLTGLFNRGAFIERLKLAFADAKRNGRLFALLYLDIDHFKDVNDAFSHKVGDLLLQLVADRLSGTIRQTDALARFSVARFGGDEFAVLETDMSDPSDAAALAERIVKAMAEPFLLSGKDIHITVSIGISLYSDALAEENELLVQADLALYRAKEEGRGRFHFYSVDMDAKVRERVAIGEELHSALQNGELELYYQPQVEIPSGEIIGVEALMRWNHPTRGMLQPDQFIPIAEKTGIIGAMGSWAIKEACQQSERWRSEGLHLPMVSVNVSAVQFRNPAGLLGVVEEALSDWDTKSAILELELTESVLIEATQAHSDILDRFHALGVRLAIDDFGTGYSSLEYLHAYPIDRIKIAQQFMRYIPFDVGAAAIVKATIALAQALNLEIIAEGVETREQLDFLSRAGCRSIQGYCFSRPVPAKGMAQFLRRKRFDLPLENVEDESQNVPAPEHPPTALTVRTPVTSPVT